MRIDDLAAHAEILQHTGERGGGLVDRLLVRRIALVGLWRREQVDRGKLEPAASGRARARRLAGARRRLLLVLVFLFLLVGFVRFIPGGLAHARLDARAAQPARRRHGVAIVAGALEPGLEGEE